MPVEFSGNTVKLTAGGGVMTLTKQNGKDNGWLSVRYTCGSWWDKDLHTNSWAINREELKEFLRLTEPGVDIVKERLEEKIAKVEKELHEIKRHMDRR